jgi:DNA-binding HxlR family transcriptional regulator
MQAAQPARSASPTRAAGRHEPRSTCPVACSLDLIGDRWSLLVIRDLLLGKSRYGEFLASAEGIPTNILAERLKRLEQAGIISTTVDARHPRRKTYQLTRAGRALAPAIRALRDWGLAQFPGARPPEQST